MSTMHCWPASSNLSHYLLDGDRPESARYSESSAALPVVVRLSGWPTRTHHMDGCQPADLADSASAGTDARQALIQKLGEYTSLPDDWDGYGGTAATIETFLDTCDFLKRYPSTFPTPKPMIGSSGVIGLYWEDNDCYASIEFDGSGCYCYTADCPGNSCRAERVPVSDALPRQLSEFLSLIAVPRPPRLLPDDPAGNAVFAALLERMPDAGQDDDFERLDETSVPRDVFD